MEKKALIVFQKNAIPGKVKTRLAADVGDEYALEVYQLLVDYTYKTIERVAVDKFMYYSDFNPENPRDSFMGVEATVQEGRDLGTRMGHAFTDLFSQAYDKVVVIGTDCAELTLGILDEAFELLDQSEVVIGPAEDGGYYLLGMKRWIPELFVDIPWSTDQVLEKTKNILESMGVAYQLLCPLSDIDHLEDWNRIKDRFKHKVNYGQHG